MKATTNARAAQAGAQSHPLEHDDKIVAGRDAVRDDPFAKKEAIAAFLASDRLRNARFTPS